jgi:hypothetical protein
MADTPRIFFLWVMAAINSTVAAALAYVAYQMLRYPPPDGWQLGPFKLWQFALTYLALMSLAAGLAVVGSRFWRILLMIMATGLVAFGVWIRAAAFRQADFTWSAEPLDRWLRNPREFIQGSRMVFMAIDQPQDRANLIAF